MPPYPKPVKQAKIKKIGIKNFSERSLPKLKKDLEKAFNLFIRLRDSQNGYCKCISCGSIKSFKEIQCGHFISVQQSAALRFNEDNTAGQCLHCNVYNQGNFPGYLEGLTAKIGKERVDKLLMSKNNPSKMGRFELTHLIEVYKEKVKNFRQ